MALNNFSKNTLIQKYLDKTTWDSWSESNEIDDNNNVNNSKSNSNNSNNNDNGFGFPSLEYLQEIQKSISYKLGRKYKYYGNIDDGKESDSNNDESQDEDSVNSNKENSDNDGSDNDGSDNNGSDNENDDKQENEKKRKRGNKDSNKSSRNKIIRLQKEFNRYPLSEPNLKQTSFNEICGTDILMTLGILQQQILISEIKKLNSYNNDNNSK